MRDIDNIENGMILDNEIEDYISADDYEYYYQDDWRKEEEIENGMFQDDSE